MKSVSTYVKRGDNFSRDDSNRSSLPSRDSSEPRNAANSHSESQAERIRKAQAARVNVPRTILKTEAATDVRDIAAAVARRPPPSYSEQAVHVRLYATIPY